MALEDVLKIKTWAQRYRLTDLDSVLGDIKLQIIAFFERNKNSAKSYLDNIKGSIESWKEFHDDLYRAPEIVFDQFIEHLAYFYFELYMITTGKVSDVLSMVDTKSVVVQQNWRNNLSQMLSNKKGLILISSHYGAYENIPVILAANDLDVCSITKLESNFVRQLKARTSSIRTSRTFEYINYSGDNVFIKARECLANNNVVVVPCDEYTTWSADPNTKTKFAGREFPCDKFIDELKNESGAPVVMMTLRRLSVDCMKQPNYLMKVISNLGETPSSKAFDFLSAEVLRNPEQYMYWNELGLVSEIKKKKEGKKNARKK